MINCKVKLMTEKDLNWDFEMSKPTYYLRTQYGWGHSVEIDPFPCYSHSLELVKDLITDTWNKFPIKNPLCFYILPYETTGRTNGWHTPYSIYEDEQIKEKCGFEWESIIILAGKRIPIMPTMTEYLVSHEYGHYVERYLQEKMGFQNRDEILAAYAKVRGIELNREYGGKKWHTNTGEIFANDFRILVCGRTPEFWPHDVEHPSKCENIKNWWNTARQLIT